MPHNILQSDCKHHTHASYITHLIPEGWWRLAAQTRWAPPGWAPTPPSGVQPAGSNSPRPSYWGTPSRTLHTAPRVQPQTFLSHAHEYVLKRLSVARIKGSNRVHEHTDMIYFLILSFISLLLTYSFIFLICTILVGFYFIHRVENSCWRFLVVLVFTLLTELS